MILRKRVEDFIDCEKIDRMYRTLVDMIPDQPRTDKCLVLDLDETLVHTSEEPHKLRELGIFSDPKLLDLRYRTYHLKLDDVVEKRGTGVRTELWGVERPHLREFLLFALGYFRVVAIWSAGQLKYVESIADRIFRDLKPPSVIYSWSQCRNDNGMLEKPLRQMFDDQTLAQAGASLMKPENTLVVDDRLTTFANVNPENGILIPGYSPSPTISDLMRDDQALLQLIRWLSQPEVMSAPDVRILDKSRIFTQ